MPPKKNPFDDDDEDLSTDKANKAAVDEVKRAVEGAAEKIQAESAVEVDLDDAEEAIEGREQSPEQRESRNERRRNRYREVQDRERAATEAREAAERRAEAAERRAQETHQLLMQLQQRSAPTTPESNPLEAELDKTFAEQDMLYRDFRVRGDQLTPEEHEEYVKKARAYQRKIVALAARVELKAQGIDKVPDEKQIRAQILSEELQRRHGDVLTDEKTRMYSDGAWKQLIAEGKPDNWDTIDEAMEMTRRRFNIPSKRKGNPPSQSYKSKLTGSGRGAGPSNGDGPKTVTMTKELQAMANEMYRHIPDEKKRMQLWANSAGRKLNQG